VIEYPWVFGHVGFFIALGARQLPQPAGNEFVDQADVTQQPLRTGVTIMGGKTDVVKGRIKEAAGALTGNDKLRAEGKADQAVGKVKQAATKVVDKVKKALK
jgi:uncharacterized protein YjbJ (UPF0337 family)